jgi:Protein of unknown function (DUF2950)
MKMTLALQSSQSKEFEMMRGMNSGFDQRHVSRPTARAALVACALLMAGSVKLCLAGPSIQTTFPSPDDASRALVSAAQEHDERAVTEILGGGSELVGSDDKAGDTLDREHFVQKYQEMHRWVRESGAIMTLYIGAENWPFPVPLVSRNGVWRFDSEAGSNEIRFRRIGENEVTAIGMCDALVTAEKQPGTDSEANRLVKTLLPNIQSASKPIRFHGYYFHIMSNSGGGFSAIAYPVMYRSSGVMTFVVTQDGGVSEKDLGKNTAKIAGAMTSYHSDATWVPAEATP